MGWDSTKTFVEQTVFNGKQRIFSWRKVPSQATAQGVWSDFSMAPGNPPPNYYASSPLVASLMPAGGLYTGGPVSPATKHLKEILVIAPSAFGVPASFILRDYIAYYPFIDQSTTDEQVLDNTGFTLPRHESGEGVMMMPVMVAPQSGLVSTRFSVKYDDGVTEQTSPEVVGNTTSVNSTILSSSAATNLASGPFIPLAPGSTTKAVKKINSVTMTVTDTGLFALVLVKPIASFTVRDTTAPVEVCFFKDTPSMPKIADGAYLNLISCATTNQANVQFLGTITTVWN